MKTEEILINYGDEIYFFILSKIKDKTISDDVFQNIFLKIHEKLYQLKDTTKAKSWVFQITRNEITNYFKNISIYTDVVPKEVQDDSFKIDDVCCFNKVIDELPKKYNQVIELTYIEGFKQQETADKLQISLANVKARILRGKEMIKAELHKCCKYEIDNQGNLSGEADCISCE